MKNLKLQWLDKIPPPEERNPELFYYDMTHTKIDDVEMSRKEIWLKITDLENIFNIYEDDKQNLKYNLNQTLYLNVNPDSLNSYTLDHEMFWPLISYKIYNTTHLAWLLMKVNNVPAKYIFSSLRAGATVKYLDTNTVKSIVQQMRA